MNIDELILVFEKARAEAAPFPQHHEDGLYAGIAAVVRAVRDEMSNNWIDCSHCDQNTKLFNEILGDAGEKVVETPDLPTRTVQLTGITKSPRPDVQFEAATAPATDVCEWTRAPYTALYSSCCDEDYLHNVTDSGMCHRCGRPIKFTEAKT